MLRQISVSVNVVIIILEIDKLNNHNVFKDNYKIQAVMVCFIVDLEILIVTYELASFLFTKMVKSFNSRTFYLLIFLPILTLKYLP